MNSKQAGKEARAAQLRAKAEAELARVIGVLDEAPDCSTEEILHELQVHQIELEMQNEALRQSQVLLEESRDSYVKLYDLAPVGYLTLTDQGLIAKINLTCATLLGMERNKLQQRRFSQFVMPEDSDRWHRHFQHTLKHDEKQSCELALRRSDGSVLHAWLNCQRVAADENSSSVHIALTDITAHNQATTINLQILSELRKKHEQLITLVDVLPDAIYLKDGESRWQTTNQVGRDLFDLQGKDWRGKTDLEMANEMPELRSVFEACVESDEMAFRSGGMYQTEEYITGTDGTRRDIEVRKFPRFAADGSRAGLVVIGRDITQQKAIQSALIKSEAKHKEQAKLLQTVLDALPAQVCAW